MDKEDFIKECMIKLKDDFPDEKQRLAVCFSKWERGETDIKKFEKTDNKKEILIFPKGKFFIEKYNEWLTFDDDFFDKVLEAFNSKTLPKPFVDIDHDQGKSCGEVVDLYKKEAGLYGVVEFNENGLKLLKDKEYRYISPSFGEIIDNTGKKFDIYLDSISFTNIPALLNTMPKLQEQLKLTKKIFKGGNMKNKKIILSQITDEAIKNFVEDLLSQGEKMEDVINSLNLQIEELRAKLEETEKANEDLKKENETIKQEQMNREADEFIKKQIEMKKLNVKHADYWRKQFLLNKEDVINYFDCIMTEENNGIYKLSNKYNLNQEDILVMQSTGLDINNEKDIDFYLKINKIKKGV